MRDVSKQFGTHPEYRIDEIADRFEAALQRGEQPCLADYVSMIEPDNQTELMAELIRIDFSCRLGKCPDLSIDEFLQDFQRLRESHPDVLHQLASDLRRIQLQSGMAPRRNPDKVAARQFVGRFRLLEELGSGSFGKVFRAEDPELRRYVAVKIPRTTAFATGEERRRFIQEARSLAGLQHPGIVAVHEIGYDGDLPFFVTDYVDGPSLAAELARRRFSYTDAARLVAEVADALHSSHVQGVIHRDVSPSNILIDRNWRPFVTDFGLARVSSTESTVTVPGQILGTPAYMSPEQASGNSMSVDARSDIYGLGVVLFELLTGERPFRGDAAMVLHQVLHAQPVAPRSLDHRIPVDLETICCRAMAKLPQHRYASAAEFRDDLRRFLSGNPIVARPVGVIERTSLWARRNQAVAGLLFAVAVLVLVVAVFGTVMTVQLATAEADARIQLSRAQAEAGILELEAGAATGLLRLLQSYETAQENMIEKRSRFSLLSGWHRDTGGQLQNVIGHQHAVRAATFSPDGSLIVTAAADGEVAVWEAASGGNITRLSGHKGEFGATRWRITFSNDGSRLLTSTQRTAVVWDTLGWTAIGENLCEASAMSSDGELWALASRNGLEVRRIDDGSVVFGPWPMLAVRGIHFSPDNQTLAVATGFGSARLWNLSTGLPVGSELRHETTQTIDSSEMSPDGRLFATGSWDDSARLWQTADGSPVGEFLQHSEDIRQLCFSPDSRLLATASYDGCVRIWNTDTSQAAIPPLQHGCPVLAIAFSSDGRFLGSGGMNGVISIWEIATAKRLDVAAAHQGQINGIAFDRAGTRFVTASNDTTARIWSFGDSRPEQRILSHIGRVWETDISHDNAFVAGVTESSYLHVWDLSRNSPVCDPIAVTDGRFNSHGLHAEILTCCFHPSEPLLATATSNGRIMFWDVAASGVSLRAEKDFETNSVRRLAFSPDGNALAVATNHKTAAIWRAWRSAAEPEIIAHPSPLWTVQFSPDGKSLATGGDDGIVRVFSLTNAARLTAALPHDGAVSSIAFSTDGEFLVSAAADHSVRLWDCRTWQHRDSTFRVRANVEYVTVSPDCGQIATACNNGQAQIWDIVTGLPCGKPNVHSMFATSVRFSADGRYLLSSSFDGTVCLRTIRPRIEPAEPETLRQTLIRELGARIDRGGVPRAVSWQEWQKIRPGSAD